MGRDDTHNTPRAPQPNPQSSLTTKTHEQTLFMEGVAVRLYLSVEKSVWPFIALKMEQVATYIPFSISIIQFSIIYLGNLEKLYFVARKYSVIRRTPSFEQILIKQAYFLVKNGAPNK